MDTLMRNQFWQQIPLNTSNDDGIEKYQQKGKDGDNTTWNLGEGHICL